MKPKKNELSILGHAEIIDYLFAVSEEPFCIQDPDCFITECDFYKELSLDDETEFAAGPFTKRPTDHDHVLPDTFFLILNPRVFKKISRKYGVTARTNKLAGSALHCAKSLGYSQEAYPEQFKGYFDTLQAFWVLALAEGYSFKKVPGTGKSIFHIGGTSYLHNSDYALDHWDYWPLSVQYFNMRLLEMPVNACFREKHLILFRTYDSAKRLTEMYPQFKEGRRYAECEKILQSIC